MRPWLYVITWEALWHMPDVCYKCKVEIHGVCVPTQMGARCACQRSKCRGTVKPAGGGFEHSDTNRTQTTGSVITVNVATGTGAGV